MKAYHLLDIVVIALLLYACYCIATNGQGAIAMLNNALQAISSLLAPIVG